MMNKFKGPEDPGYRDVAGKIEEILQNIRTNSLLDEADTWIRTRHYTADRLKIERLSGDLLSMNQCYINLAVVEHHGQGADRTEDGAGAPSPFSLFDRQKVATPDKTIQVQLETIFNEREGRNGTTIQPRRILIRGRAGVGKTTLCKKIIYEFTQGAWSDWNTLFDRVLWVPLRNLKLKERCEMAGYNFEQLFAHEFFSLSSEKSVFARELFLAYELELEANNSRTLFLLDGLDEVSQDLGDGSMSGFLNELLKQPNIIVTSRPSGRMPLDLDLELETIGFYPDQVKDYLKHVLVNPRTVNKVQSFLQSHWLIQGLVRIPIQLDALCYCWKDIRSDMPETMTALYQAIELSLWKKDILRLRKTHYQNPITVDHIQDASRQQIERFVEDEILFLESLAFTGLYDDTIDFEQKHLNRISDSIRDFLPGMTVPCLSFLRTSTPSSKDRNGSYHFIHLTFQEYFAARYFVRQWLAEEPLNCVKLGSSGTRDESEPIKFFQKHKYTARYNILWRFVAGLFNAGKKELPFYTPKVEEFFEKIEEEPLDLLGPTHQRLVMHCLSEVSGELSIRAKLEQRLSRWLLFEYEFVQTSWTYSGTEIEFPEQALDTAFREGSDDIKNKILQSITQRATVPASIIDWATSWPGYKDWHFGWSSKLTIGRRALLDEIHKCVTARLKDEDMSVRWGTVKVISREDHNPPNEILRDVVTQLDHKDAFVQEAAAAVLSQTTLPNEILRAVAVRLKDKDVSVRKAAAKALRLEALPDEILEDVSEQLENKSKSIRQALVGALNQQALPIEALKYIVSQLKDKDVSVQEAAATALNLLVLPREILKDISAQLEDKDKSVQRAAFNTLGQQPALPNEILEAIITRLEDIDESVRSAAAWALRQQALPTEILKKIITMLKSENKCIRVNATSALHQVAALPNEILKAVAARLEDEDEDVRKVAILALDRQPVLPKEMLKAVAARLEDDNETSTIRKTAINILGKQPVLPYETFEIITTQLKNKDRNLREIAVKVLCQHPALPDEILIALITQSEDGDMFGEVASYEVLYQRASLSNEILNAVAARLEDKNANVRYCVICVLDALPVLPQEIIKTLTTQLNDEKPYIRRWIIRVLNRQPTLLNETLKALTLRLKDHNESVQEAAEAVIRRHEELYCTLLKGEYVTSIYKILLRQSFQEQLSCYIEDGHFCLNMPEGIRRVSIGKHDNIMNVITSARPANFPAR